MGAVAEAVICCYPPDESAHHELAANRPRRID